MHINLIAVGTRMPSWVNDGYQTYAERLPSDMSLNLTEVPAQKRRKGSDISKLLEHEGEHILKVINPQDRIIALERTGKVLDTLTLSNKLEAWRNESQSISLLIGGPEGLSNACIQKAHETWSLSALTMPHPLVRILVAEQIYRAWSILMHHPYHR